MRHHRTWFMSLQAVTLLAGLAGGARAGDVSHQDRAATTPVSAERRDALDRLEQAEIVLLNRHVYDLGPQLRTDRPVPPVSAISDLDRARLAVLTADAHHARQAVTASRPSPLFSTSRKETTP